MTLAPTPQSTTEPASLNSVYITLLKTPNLWQKDMQTALQLIATKCANVLAVERVSIWQKSPAGNALTCRVLCESDSCLVNPDRIIEKSDHSAYFHAFDHERVIAATDARNDPRTRSFVDEHFQPLGVISTLDATLREEGNPTGIIRFEHAGQAREWKDDEKNFVVSISDLLSQVVIFHSLKDSQERYRKVFDSAGDAIIIMHNYKMVDCNEAALSLFKCNKEQLFSVSQTYFWPERQPNGKRSRDLAKQIFDSVFQTGYLRFEWSLTDWNGEAFDTDISITHTPLEGKPHLVLSIRDISETKRANKKILELNSLQQAIFDGANYSIIATDELGLIHTFNRAAEQLLGYSADEVIGRKTPDCFHDVQETNWRARELSEELGWPVDANFEAYIAKAKLGNIEDIECTYIHKEGYGIPIMLSVSTLRDDDNRITGFLSIASDMTERKRANEELLDSKREMERRANHDNLTGLPNRSRLHDVARVAIHDAATHNRGLALMLLDLNRFKDVNDTLGHAAGDLMLKRVAERLQNMLATHGAYLYRLGGDEFAILLSKIASRRQVEKTADLISECLRKPVELDDLTLELGGSIGIALFPDHGDNSHALLRCADVAMYKAKSSSTPALIYEPSFDAHSPRRLALMSELGAAIRENQLVLHYQPRINIQRNACVGCEALIRWQHPKLGLIPPGEFIPFAERSDFIQPLSLWVLETAIKQIKSWMSTGREMLVSINLSAKNLINLAFSSHIENLLRAYNVPPELLEIEITESALINDPERALKTINHIHGLGVRFAIDDFGTGYSSLSYLKRLPIDTLKIDQTFIADMLEDEQDAVIVRSTINLAHSFDLEVVAEGVEDHATLTALKFLKCEQAQGFLISKPVPIHAFEVWLSEFNSST